MSKSHLEASARQAMAEVDASLEDEFAAVMAFLRDNPESARYRAGKNPPPFGSAEHLDIEARRFANGRVVKLPSKSKTIADEAVSKLMATHYNVQRNRLEEVSEEHRQSMAAENFIGHLLERYISTGFRDTGWVWCSGELVKSVDFIRRAPGNGLVWEALQVKNRDNSENSSSSAIRKGTSIQKWHRTKSRSGKTCWESFPAVTSQPLTEEGFFDYIDRYFDQSKRTSI